MCLYNKLIMLRYLILLYILRGIEVLYPKVVLHYLVLSCLPYLQCTTAQRALSRSEHTTSIFTRSRLVKWSVSLLPTRLANSGSTASYAYVRATTFTIPVRQPLKTPAHVTPGTCHSGHVSPRTRFRAHVLSTPTDLIG